MSQIRTAVVATLGWGFIGATLYICTCLTVYVIAALLPWAVDLFPIRHYQEFHYFFGGRHIWQDDPACSQPDPELIYKPRDGACHFVNLEFDTVLNFDAEGRRVPAREHADMTQRGIAVLGDSHGMGWGVEDAETFANVMQTQVQQPVYNLSVSSYGTERELKRLSLSGLAADVDTIVILYCDNDLGENLTLQTPQDYAQAVHEYVTEPLLGEGFADAEDKIEFVKALLSAILIDTVKMPLRRLLKRPDYPPIQDFNRHIGPLRETLQRYSSLLADKHVYVVYVIPDGQRFDHFTAGPDPMLPNVTYLEMPFVRDDFFVIDDHLSAKGHRRLGEWLALTLPQQGHAAP